ncbi:GNAT family N-acetyltransferase [Photobacterium damselae]|uniref:GNAT family N-acetyltransferase n=1 Tax=Photobacterium damselae TaxID=38293 RepID=UPI004068170D
MAEDKNIEIKVTIRPYQEQDAEHLWSLLFNTIRSVNIRDYSQEQVEAWAPKPHNTKAWRDRVNQTQPYIAELNGVIVGFADLQSDGLIDHFFCHHRYQRQGVGSALMAHIFIKAQELGLQKLYSEVSITARPFFEQYGFKVVTAQKVALRGIVLDNFLMQKA